MPTFEAIARTVHDQFKALFNDLEMVFGAYLGWYLVAFLHLPSAPATPTAPLVPRTTPLPFPVPYLRYPSCFDLVSLTALHNAVDLFDSPNLWPNTAGNGTDFSCTPLNVYGTISTETLHIPLTEHKISGLRDSLNRLHRNREHFVQVGRKLEERFHRYCGTPLMWILVVDNTPVEFIRLERAYGWVWHMQQELMWDAVKHAHEMADPIYRDCIEERMVCAAK
jgi:hypothetical protein